MTTEYMGNLGSMIGGLAIFVSLLYLAVETRVNPELSAEGRQRKFSRAVRDARSE